MTYIDKQNKATTGSAKVSGCFTPKQEFIYYMQVENLYFGAPVYLTAPEIEGFNPPWRSIPVWTNLNHTYSLDRVVSISLGDQFQFGLPETCRRPETLARFQSPLEINSSLEILVTVR